MRITSGKYRGLPLKVPKSSEIRPMMDKVRKALFDSLGPAVQDCRVLDLFCGTGALGLEALSRGAKEVVFIDHGREALSLIRENLKRTSETEARILKLELPRGLSRLEGPFDLIFVTPPYGKGLAKRTLLALPEDLLSEEAIVVVEERTGEELPPETSLLTRFKQKRYGQTELHFYRRKS